MNLSLSVFAAFVFLGSAILKAISSNEINSYTSSSSSSSSSDDPVPFLVDPSHVARKEKWDIAHKLEEAEAYDELIEYMALNKEATGIIFILQDIEVNKILMEKIINLNETIYHNLESVLKNGADDLDVAKFKLYRHLLGFLKYTSSVINFIISGIVAGVPENWYLDIVLASEPTSKEKFYNQIFAEDEIFESTAETLRIYNTLAEIISSNENARFYSLLNLIRFGEVVDLEYCKRECDEMAIDDLKLILVFKAAALGQKNQIVAWIYQLKKLESDFKYELKSPYIIFGLLNSVSESEIKEILTNISIFQELVRMYDIVDFRYNDSTGFHSFDLRLPQSERDSKNGLPDSFQYDMKFDFSEKNGDHSILMRNIIRNPLFLSSHLTPAKVLMFLNVIIDLEASRQILIESYKIYASYEVVKAISENEQIRQLILDYKLKFELISDQDYAKIFEKPVKSLVGILIKVPYKMYGHLKTENQIRNVEEFDGKSVDEFFLNDVVPRPLAQYGIKKDSFETYRSILHYWLNGPNRARLLELRPKYSYFLEKLAEEVGPEDAKFLLE